MDLDGSVVGGSRAGCVAYSVFGGAIERCRRLAQCQSARCSVPSGAARSLRQEASSAEGSADRLLAQRAALAAEIDAANAQIAAARARIAIIAAEQKRQAAALGEASEPLLRLNAMLQKMTQQPTALLLTQAGDRRDYVHLRATMAAIEPAITRRTAALRRQIAAQRELRAQELVAIGSLQAARKELAKRRTSLAALENESRDKAMMLGADAALEFERAIGQGERARDLVERIDANRDARKMPQRLPNSMCRRRAVRGAATRPKAAPIFCLRADESSQALVSLTPPATVNVASGWQLPLRRALLRRRRAKSPMPGAIAALAISSSSIMAVVGRRWSPI